MTERREQAGFTLIELMISLVLFSFAVAGVLAVAVSMTQGFREQRQAAATETSARVPVDFLTDVLRQAAPGVSDPTLIQDSITCAIGGITVYNGSGTNSSDVLDVVYALGGVVTTTQTAYTGGASLDVSDASQLAVNDYILVSNLTQGHLFKIASKSGNSLTLVTPCAITLPAAGYPQGSLVVRAQHAMFSIGTVDGNPALMMDPDSTATANAAEPLADGVEDLQVALGIDQGVDGVSEVGTAPGDDEWIYNAAGETLPASGTWRAVRLSLVARTSTQLNAGMGATLFNRPQLEDHAAGTADAYRRRVLRTIVEIRNTGVSP